MTDERRGRRSAQGRTVLAMLSAVLLAGQWLTCAAGRSAASSEATALVHEVARYDMNMSARRREYTWTVKVPDREQGKGGDVKKQSVNVCEVYPVHGEFARKLVSRDGIPAQQERAEEE